MRKILLLLTFCVAALTSVKSQNLSYSCPRDTILACGNPCLNIVATIPDIRSLATDYTISNITPQTQCYPLVDPGGAGPSANLAIDDRYSAVINLPFTFPFYGTNYNSLIVSTNGYVSFDVSEAGNFSHWTDQGNLPTTNYDRALIMGPYHDLQPGVTTSPTQKIKYNTVGTAPNRLWILSFYRVPLFDCNDLIENTHQIVLYEASGVVEVHIKDKQICTTWEDGRSMVGMQNFAQNLGIMAPNRRETDPQWGSIGMNETWRFIPKNGPTTYRRTELIDGAGTVVAVGDTTRVNANTFSVTFPNVCPPANLTTTYVVKTTYTSVLNPANTYYSLDTIFVTRQNSLPIDTTTTQTACGGSTGTITATASGGTPPYQYSINMGPFQPSGTFTGLAQGTYVIIGIDATGCTDTLQVPITAIANIPGTVASTPTGCPGVNNGTITVTPGGGTGPYTFSLDGGAPGNTNVITGVAAGPHTVVFTDANGCSGVVNTTVGAGASITSSSSTSSSTCAGANNGSATITPTSGAGPYTFSLDGGTPQSSNVFTGLAGGNHSVLITDAAGCTGSRTFFINTGAGISISTSSTPESCTGAADGTITVTNNNGTAPFTYTLDGGTAQSSNVFTGVVSGFHTVVVRDANNCTATQSLPVSVGTGITATATSTATACPGVANGSITVTPNPAAGSYTYSLDGGTPQASATFNGVSDGAHTVTVVAGGGCTVTVNVSVAAGTSITGTTTTTATACPGVDNGTITVTPTNGTAPYEYSLDGTTFQTSNVLTGVGEGPQSVTVRDASGCTGTLSVTVPAGTTITGTATSTATACPGSASGTITVTPTSGTGPYTYSKDGTTFQASSTLTGFAAGAHTITVRDANGCTGIVNATVTDGTVLTGTATSSATACPGVDNGSITATPTNGSAPYQYSLDGGATQAGGTFNGVAAGAHTVTITDANGCSGTVNVTVAAGTNINGSATSTASSCPVAADGTITATTTNGTAPFTYSIDGTTFQASNIFTGVLAGDYTVDFRDASGCTGSTTVTVSAGTGLTGTATTTDASCPGVNNGSITVTPDAGIGQAPFTYALDGGAPQASGIFNGIAAGAHVIVISDALGCTGTVNATVASGTTITGTAATTSTTCPGVNNGTVDITPGASATAPFTFSLDGGTAQASGTFTGLSSGAHTVVITDGNGCSAPVNFTIGSDAVVTGTATSLVAASCPGVNNGEATITPNAPAVAPFTYSMDGGASQNSATFTGLSAGAHTATFIDANGCVGTVTFTIASGGLLTGSYSEVPATCPTATNGSITVSPTAGAGPYLYSLDGGVPQASATFSNLATGNYVITFTDGLGCLSEDINATVTSEPALTVTATPVSASCPGVNNGSVTLNPDAAAVAPFTFTLDGGTPQSSAIFTGLASGSHTATFSDANGCPATVTFTVGTGAPVNGQATSLVSASCPGVNNGEATITPDAPATAPFTFSVDGGASQASGTFSGLSAGAHTSTFIDANGCVGIVNFTIASGGLLTGNYTEAPATCPTASNGSITVTPTAGSGPYLYSLDGGAPQASATFSNLAPGNYTVTFTDGLGCLSENISATVTSAPALTVTATPVDATCPGVNNGSVTLNPDAAAVAPFAFSLDGGTSQSSPTFTGLATGSHTVTFTDANGCPASVTFNIGTGADLTATTSSTETSCPGVNNGTITVTPTSGTGPYLYSLDGGASQASATFSNLAPGSYSITFIDAIGCSGTVSGSVDEGVSISSTLDPVQPVCNGIDDGQITITPTSGVAPYTYSINGGTAQASPSFTSLAPGTYDILVTDGVGCTGTNSTVLATNPAIVLGSSKEDPLCFGTTDGSITISATGGVSPYEYSIDAGANYQSSPTFGGLGQGAYSITVRDNVGCTKLINENLVQPTPLTASTATTPSTCQGGDGTITITAAGGTPNYLYSVDNGATFPFQSSNVFNVGKGNYTNVAVKDANGCVEIVSAIVGEIDVMGPLFIGNDTTVCQGQPVTFDPQVHPQATVFRWRENIYLDSDTIKHATATPEDTTMYILTAQWGACQREDTIMVNVLLRPIPDAGSDQRICLNDSTTISGTVSHTSGPVTLVWSPAEKVHDDSSATTIAVPGGTQVYTLTAYDDYGCNFSEADSVLIIMQPAVPAFAGGDTLVTVNLPFQLAGSGGEQYLWSTNSSVATIADPTVQRPTVTSTGDANFMLQVTDIAGCIGFDTVYVQVYQGPEYYVPNAFSPNGDGLNDVFRAIPVGMTRPEYFRVFNRYGELVFETNQYLKGWDGTFKGKLQPMGTYIWILKGEDRKGRKVEMRGTVMIVQ